MLELIVLGQVPGSQAQLTFGHVMMLWLGFILVVLIRVRGRKIKNTLKIEAEMLLIYLSLRFGQKSSFARWQNALAVKLKLF